MPATTYRPATGATAWHPGQSLIDPVVIVGGGLQLSDDDDATYTDQSRVKRTDTTASVNPVQATMPTESTLPFPFDEENVTTVWRVRAQTITGVGRVQIRALDNRFGNSIGPDCWASPPASAGWVTGAYSPAHTEGNAQQVMNALRNGWLDVLLFAADTGTTVRVFEVALDLSYGAPVVVTRSQPARRLFPRHDGVWHQ